MAGGAAIADGGGAMKFTSLTRRFLLWFVVVALLPLALSGVLSLRESEATLREEALGRMSRLADRRLLLIKNYLAERVHDALILAREPSTARAMEALGLAYRQHGQASPQYRRADGDIRNYLATFIDEGALFYDVFLITPEGEIVYTDKHESDFATNLLTGPYRESQLARAFGQTRLTLESSISDFEYYSPSDAPAAFVTAPILHEGRLLGVVALQLGTGSIYRVTGDLSGLGATGETTLGRRTGDGEALFVAPLRRDPDAAMRLKADLSNSASPMRYALQGLRGSGLATDYSGTPVVAAWRYLPELRWGVVVKMDEDEAFAPLYRQRALLSGGLLALTLFAGLAALYLGRGMVDSLRDFAATAEEIAAGDLSRRVDESGRDEIGMLARAFNRMAANLQALYQSLEDRIEERTRELNVTNEQLQEEVVERMHTEQTLKLSNNELVLYKRFMDRSSNAMSMALLDGRLTYGNQALCDLLGVRPEALGEHSVEEFLRDEHLSLWRDTIMPAVMREGNWSGEIGLVDIDGKPRDTESEVFMVEDANGQPYALAMVIADITERKRAEALLLRHKIVLDTAQEGFWVSDAQGRLIEANEAYAAMSGYSVDELLAMRIDQLEAGEDPDEVRAHIEKVRMQGHDRFETRHRRKDGRLIDIEVSTTYEPGSGQFFVFCRDITGRKRAQLELQRSRDMLNEAQRLGRLGSWELDLVGGELRWSDEIYRIFELDPDRFSPSYENFLNAIHPDDRDMVNQAYTQSLEDRRPYDIVHRLRTAGGHVKWVREHCSSDFDDAGKPLRSVGAVQDITEQKHAEDQLRIAAATFETHEAIMITDANANILRVNRAFEETTGYHAEEVLGKNPRILSSGRQDQAFYAEMWTQLKEKGSWTGEMWDRRKGGQVYPKWLTITAVRNPRDEITEYVAIFSDITARKQAEEEIRNLAFYDALTQLPNRRLLLDRLHLALSASSRSQSHGALLFLDMDRFKVLNDTLGHDYGDLLLIEVAERIKHCVREVDTVARLGGDEFVVLLEELGREVPEASQRAAQVAEKIRAALAEPYSLKESVHRSSPSIGVSLYRGNAEPVEVLLKQADMAMYQAKESGRNAVRFFDPQMQLAVETRAMLEADLRNAIANDELRLHYQVQVDREFRPLGVEALVRWQHPKRGMVSPGQFIPIAEESSLILDIGDWVLETACAQLASWRNYRITRELSIAVNVSAAQFRKPDFVEQVAALLRRNGVEPSRLKLELTESVVMGDVADVIARMHELKSLGVKLSMDDFGTGYSSLSYLKQLPLDQLKIDQSFVRDIVADSSDAVMVRTIIDLAQNFDLDVVAEGVETDEQRLFLKQHGCDAYQGYLFSRPVPVEEFERSLGGL
jgi:diguanylate cyclase (GGDEF)-like protein/PAS domain S-box-containing protein